MKKKIGTLLAALSLSLFTSTTAFAAVDQDYQSYTLANGTKLNTYHWLTYPDVKCGMNTVARYTGVASKKVPKFNLNWTIWNAGSTAQLQSGSKPNINTTSVTDKSKTAVIGRSQAKWKIGNSKQTWSPSGFAYHCKSLKSTSLSASTKSIENAENTAVALENSSELPNQFSNIDEYNKKDQKTIIADTFNENYSEELNAYTLSDGSRLTGEDLILESIENNIGKKMEDKETSLTIGKSEPTQFSYVKVKAPADIQKNGKTFEVEGYILISNNLTSDALDFGLVETQAN